LKRNQFLNLKICLGRFFFSIFIFFRNSYEVDCQVIKIITL
jgi:hypothetical protein